MCALNSYDHDHTLKKNLVQRAPGLISILKSLKSHLHSDKKPKLSLFSFLASKVRLVTLELSVTLMRVAMCGAGGGASARHAPAADALRARAAALARNFYKCDDIFLDMFEDE